MSKFSPLALIKQQQEENKYRTQVLDLREVQEHPKNDFPITEEDIQTLAESILKSDGILQFPLVRLLEDGSYQMLAGHRRRRASLLLGETFDEKFYRTMCYILEDVSDERAELFLIDTNVQSRTLSPKLKARKVAEARDLIQSLKERGEINVRSIRRAVSEVTGVSESTIILQTRIAEKLDKDLLELYDQGRFTMRQAYDYSGFPQDVQEKILGVYLEELDEEETKQRISKILLHEKIGVGKPARSNKEVSKKINNAYKQLSLLSEMKSEGVELDLASLKQLRELLDKLLTE